MRLRTCAATIAFVAAVAATGPCWAWGASGHEWVSGAAIEALPDSVPAFVRTPEAVAEIALMGRELDRSKGSGETHDRERDPGHSMYFSDDAKVVGVLPIDELPATREAYDTALRAKGFTQYRAGYLFYAIVDGWQQVRKDFAYWRADVKALETVTDVNDRAWFEADKRLREMLTLRDIGVWSHYVGDASQPMHVSVHVNGWGNFPNPEGFTNEPIHAYFEGEFVRHNVQRSAVRAAIAGYEACTCTIQDRAKILIRKSLAEVAPLYRLEKDGGVKPGDARGTAFVTARLALGASTVRDMIVDAWNDSAETSVGYPMAKMQDIESGKVKVTRDLMGAD
jgi:hypothetical protein